MTGKLLQPKIKIHVFGELKLSGPNGEDLTPLASKTKGLLALLATARDLRRGRAWLQDRLWSDRAPKQASGSMRQALHDLKRVLGPWADILVATRTTVSLRGDDVELVEKPSGPSHEVEFLMGLDVRDPEFEEWLRDTRAFHAKPTEPPPEGPRRTRRVLRVGLVGSTDALGDLNFLEAVFLDQAQKSLSELFNVEFSLGLPVQVDIENGRRADLLLRVQGIDHLNGTRWLRAALDAPESLRKYWSDQVVVAHNDSMSPENHACATLVYRMVECFSALVREGRLPDAQSSELDADRLAASAFKKMFTMRKIEVREAYDLLAAATEVRPRGLYDAWRAQVNTIRHVEQQERDAEGLQEESLALIRKALEAEPMNSNVMVAAANTRLIFENDTLQAGVLSRQSVVINRANPLAWWAWSNANLYSGNFDVAYASAITAQSLGAQSPIEFWTAFQASLTAAVRGDLDQAMAYSAVSNALSPSFRPALRYLAAIAVRTGRGADARRALRRLSLLEADFSVDRMAYDPAYPVSMMHKAKLVEPDQLISMFDPI